MRKKAPKTDAKKLQLNRKEIIHHFPAAMRIAEIGVYRGSYALHLAKCKPAELCLIDIWKKVEGDSVYATIDSYNKDDDKHMQNKRLVEKRMQPYPFARTIQSNSIDAAVAFPDKYFDTVYIDGDHSFNGCLNDLRAYAPKVKDSGFLFGHDWTHTASWIEVQEAVNAFTQEASEWKLSFITSESPTGHPSWILTREGSAIIPILEATLQQSI